MSLEEDYIREGLKHVALLRACGRATGSVLHKLCAKDKTPRISTTSFP